MFEYSNMAGDIETANITKNQFEDAVRSVQRQDVNFDTYMKETDEMINQDKN